MMSVSRILLTLTVVAAQSGLLSQAFQPTPAINCNTVSVSSRQQSSLARATSSAACKVSTRYFYTAVEREQQGPTSTTSLSASEGTSGGESKLPFLLDPGTKGGAVFLSLVLFVIPIVAYSIIINVAPDVDSLEVGKWIGAGFTLVTTLGWVSTYIFRVATKNMTYAQQLKDYENAVIAKRMEELDEDEIQALVEEVERDNF